MANRYWVGGSGTWDSSTTTNWSATSGGTSGASVPTLSDDVFFDAASGAGTVTVGGVTVFSQNLTFTGFTGTFAGGGTLSIWGSLLIVSGMTYSCSAELQFRATAGAFTVTTNGKTLPCSVRFGTSGGTPTFSLQDALNITSSITVDQGTVNTNGYAVTATSLLSTNSNVRAINLGASTITLSTTGTPINFATNTNLTFNAGTSTFILSGTALGVSGGSTGVTFYNVSFTDTSATNSTHSISGINTFNNITVAAPSSAGVRTFTFDSKQTINGTLSTTGTAGNRRVWFQSANYGIAQTLTINGTPSLTDADFRDLYVIGNASPISGTRIGNLRGCDGITFSAAKTVYWVATGGGNWSANSWAATSGGAANTANFPLAQDTAIIEDTGLNTSATVTFDALIPYAGSISMSTRTNAMTFTVSGSKNVYGNWTNGSGTTIGGSSGITFSGRNTQTITSAGKTFSQSITIDSYGGTVQLGDAINLFVYSIAVLNGTFDTKNYAVTLGQLQSSTTNVRTITLGSSTISSTSSTPVDFGTNTNLTFNAGTSTITSTSTTTGFIGSGLTYYNITVGSINAGSIFSITGANTFNNLTLPAPSTTGIVNFTFSANQTINGTLTVAGATAVRRIFVQSNTLGTTRTLTVNSLSATDCDFRDITIAGAAAGSSPTRAGDCGGNSGITFTSKTVYWNLAGTQNWSATGWCPSSGGTPDINQFPLAQDTAVFDNTGSAGTVTFNVGWNIGTFNASARTSAMNLAWSTNTPVCHGNWTSGTGLTFSSIGGRLNFAKRGTQTLTSNGITFPTNLGISIVSFNGTLQLADALNAYDLNVSTGTFDAVSYNVTLLGATISGTVRMGSGTWTLTSYGTVWTASGATIYCGTANIVLSDNTTNARTFGGANKVYNKITIGGATSTSTTTFNNSDTFSELASTKTVAHTINLPSGITPTYGAWTVSGTVGNVVTISGTATLTIAGARVSGVDYLALGTTTISATSPGEFYAGANSTGGTNAILTAAPAAVTRYWVGGSGTWNAASTTNWSATSGGAGGASAPTSADTVIFDSLSNATAYTVTCTATVLRCGAITFSGPLTGNVTWAGSAPLAVHGNFTLPATGLTRSYTGTLTFSGSSTGKTITTNGVGLGGSLNINGVGCGWTLGSALTTSNNISVSKGSFDTANYNLTGNASSTFGFADENIKTVSFGSSTVLSAYFSFRTLNLTFNKGTSTISLPGASSSISVFDAQGNNNGAFDLYNISFTAATTGLPNINASLTANTIYLAANTTSVGIQTYNLYGNLTCTTLTLPASTNATYRNILKSDTVGTTRTLTIGTFTAGATDWDFRDIAVTGAAAPISGTRFGDLKGNSGITFPGAKTVYWNLFTGGNWSDTAWALTSGGAVNVNNFPLAQDAAIFEATGLNSAATVTINAAWNIGTIDMSARTSNTMTLSTTSSSSIYGNWINGTGTTLLNSSTLTFAGRGSQTITSAGKTFPQPITINTPGGSVILQDAFVSNFNGAGIGLGNGTFNSNGYSVGITGGTSAYFASGNTNVRGINFGSGSVWTISGSTSWDVNPATNFTVTGTGQISLTNASAKTFAGGDISYSGTTLNQGGAGTLTISGNNTFKDITNTYSATGASTIIFGSTTQTVSQFTGTGAASKLLTLQGTSASSPGILVLTGATNPSVDYLNVTNVRAYPINSWSAGYNSVNNGSLGFLFPVLVVSVTLETGSGADTVSATLLFSASIAEAASGVESIIGGFAFNASVVEAASGLDTPSVIGTFNITILEAASGLEEVFPSGSFSISVSETASGLDEPLGLNSMLAAVAEAASGAETGTAIATFTLAVSELASGIDDTNITGTFNIVVSESASGQDSVLSIATTNNAVSEAASGLDDQSAQLTFDLVVNEAASGVESLVSQAIITTIINEAASALEALGTTGTFNIAVTEAASGLDQESNTGIFNITITEAATGATALSARFLWEPIDNTQTLNWIDIPTQ
jgi:hypothetical protein